MEKPVPKSVIIVGGSLAGLMHALILLSLPNPPAIRILERSPTSLLHNQGAGIVAGNETQEFFDKVVKSGREIAVTSKQATSLLGSVWQSHGWKCGREAAADDELGLALSSASVAG